jgi:hypothetical protein
MTQPEVRAKVYAPEVGKKIGARLSEYLWAHPEARQVHSDRMTQSNPMAREEIRTKVSETLRGMGHCPHIQGGNGKPLSEAQRTLAEALNWPTEYIFPTIMPNGSGFPSHYKIDIANVKTMVAVEVDGRSHNVLTRKAQDRKKEAFLSERGWLVLRVSNADALNKTAEVVASIISKSVAREPTLSAQGSSSTTATN